MIQNVANKEMQKTRRGDGKKVGKMAQNKGDDKKRDRRRRGEKMAGRTTQKEENYQK